MLNKIQTIFSEIREKMIISNLKFSNLIVQDKTDNEAIKRGLEHINHARTNDLHQKFESM
jgi:hypothetical protein